MKLIKDLVQQDIKGKTIIVREDLNVPIQDGKVSDLTRIRAACETLLFLSEKGAKVIVLSHLGRPKGPEAKYSLKLIHPILEKALEKPLLFAEDCVGEFAKKKVEAMQNGDILLFENVRFHPEEENNESSFAKEWAQMGDVFIQDAFGVAHRSHASTVGIAHYLPSYAGFLLEREIQFLEKIVKHPERPLMAIIGGSKVSTKIKVLKNLLHKVDILFIGGAMSFTFLKAQGFQVGLSLWEDNQLDEAHAFLKAAQKSHTKVLFPVDQCVVPSFKEVAQKKWVDADQLSPADMGVDIGPKTVSLIKQYAKEAKTIVWNGPLGVFEIDDFAEGTIQVASILAESNALTIVGGGDSAAAIEKAKLTHCMSHISTGGGATLEFLEGKALPGIAILDKVSVNNT